MPAIPKTQQVVAILWPGFLLAGVATIVFFTVFDPEEIAALKGWSESHRLGAYTVGFFLFWMLTSLSSLLTCYFQRPCEGGRSQPSE